MSSHELRCAGESLRPRGSPSSAGSSACSLCFPVSGSGAEAARRPFHLHSQRADTDTWSEWAICRSTDLSPPWSRHGTLTMAEHGTSRSPGIGARGCEAGSNQPRDGPDRARNSSLPRRSSINSRPAGTTWRRFCSGFSSRTATACSVIAEYGRCCWRSECPSPTPWMSGMGLAGGYSDGRDIGVVFNYPNTGGAHALPMCGVTRSARVCRMGAGDRLQAQGARRRCRRRDSAGAGGDASCATGGFWSSLTIATTQQLPLLVAPVDNGYGISVPSEYQTPGKDIATNLASFRGLTISDKQRGRTWRRRS